jgi:hypothetical protein
MAVDDRCLAEEDALEIVCAAEHRRENGDLDATDFPSELLAEAGMALVRALRRQARELEGERARGYRDDASHVRGARLVDGNDGGGRRQYLRGEPVHCGDGLYVLTFNGWMAGRYERARETATFWFSVPGVAEECVIRVQPDMMFAWPSGVTPGRGSELKGGPRAAGM